ncbi:hypothetical protein GGTG_14406, partial [Gaeumannomyces tritici R3-111a-1]
VTPIVQSRLLPARSEKGSSVLHSTRMSRATAKLETGPEELEAKPGSDRRCRPS